MNVLLKKLLRRIRTVLNFWIQPQTPEYLEAIRIYEITNVISLFGKKINTKILEIGGGVGWQARLLNEHGFRIESIDITLSTASVWPVRRYDGVKIPFNDNTFDVVFSSNVLEHIPHVLQFQKEIQRVLKVNGKAVHIVPSANWRFWSNFTEAIKNWRFPIRHGEHANNAFTEIFLFKKKHWEVLFLKSGWEIVDILSNNLFYTGSSICAGKLSLNARSKLSTVLGSSCHIFVLKNKKA